MQCRSGPGVRYKRVSGGGLAIRVLGSSCCGSVLEAVMGCGGAEVVVSGG